MGISALYVVLTIVCNLFELELELEPVTLTLL